ncbi:MAG: HesA/MoeB/ThiF family protein [Alphaproteobacteria bacterium]
MDNTQLRRYARHIVLPEIGEVGQAKLLASSVLVIGAGGLGSSAIAHLAASGIGRIGVVEYDRVELSNLQRQVMFEESDIGRLKVDAVRDRLGEVNPACTLDVFPEKLTAENARTLIKPYDIVVDGSDNFDTRFAVNQACIAEQKTLVSAAISGFSAQISSFKAHLGAPHPCYQCLVPDKPTFERNCAQEGIIGPLAGMLGSMQALEVIKELLGIGESLSGKILMMDMLAATIRIAALPREVACPICSKH